MFMVNFGHFGVMEAAPWCSSSPRGEHGHRGVHPATLLHDNGWEAVINKGE